MPSPPAGCGVRGEGTQRIQGGKDDEILKLRRD